MNDVIKIVGVIVGFSLFVHGFLLSIHNRGRINKLIWYINKFNKEKKLTDKDYEYLFERYTSLFRHLEFYPDKDDFKTLYEDYEFERFVRRSKWLVKYCIIVIVVSIVVLLLIGPFEIK